MKPIKIIMCAMTISLSLSVQMFAQNSLLNNQIQIQNLTVNRVGKDLTLNMDVNMDKLKMGSNRSVVLTPVVEKDSNNKNFRSMMLNGRRQQIMYERGNRKKNYPDAIGIKRNNNKAQTVHYSQSIPYQSWMNGGKVRIAQDLCGCGHIQEQDKTDLCDYTNKVPQLMMGYQKPIEEKTKVREKEGIAYLDFPLDKTTIYPDYRRNPQELAKIIETINTVKNDKDVNIKDIQIHGFASPEGTYKHNTMLAQGRANALKEYVKKLCEFKDNQFSAVESTPENWAGLREYIAASNMTNKDAILKMIDSDKNADAKEASIKKAYPKEYASLLKDCYPGLRRSNYIVKYNVKNFDLAEALRVYKQDPDKLSVAEMYAVAESYGMNTANGRDVIYTAARLHPEDSTANLNAAIMALNCEDTNKAEEYINKSGRTADALNVKGVICTKQGRYTEATSLFEQAKEAGSKDAMQNLEKINNYIND